MNSSVFETQHLANMSGDYVLGAYEGKSVVSVRRRRFMWIDTTEHY